MVKKFIIAADSQVPAFISGNIRMLMFSKDTKRHNTIEEAEAVLETLIADPNNANNVYCVLPIYVNK